MISYIALNVKSISVNFQETAFWLQTMLFYYFQKDKMSPKIWLGGFKGEILKSLEIWLFFSELKSLYF